MSDGATSPSIPRLDARSKDLRRRILRTLEAAGRGHLGAAFSAVEILRVLYDEVLRYRIEDPSWPGRDRFILSKGHGCLTQYVLLAEKGFFPEAELQRFCREDGILGGHPEHGKVPGIEFSTGSLGHGFPAAVGMALAAKRRGATHRVFVVVGDGESSEGSIWEAALIAAKHRLDNLTVLVDYNKHATYGLVEETIGLEPLAGKWRAFGFSTVEVDGHDVTHLRKLLADVPLERGRPSAVVCHTIKGMGVPPQMRWHHKAKVSSDEIRQMLEHVEAA